jgi:hypothetical protein
MEHGEHAHGGFAGGNGPDVLLLLLGLALLAGLVLLIWWLASRRRPEASPDDAQAEARENLEGQIMAMLHQAGGSVPQSHIVASLGLSRGRGGDGAPAAGGGCLRTENLAGRGIHVQCARQMRAAAGEQRTMALADRV